MQWADQVKSQAAFRFSSDLHFVDAEGVARGTRTFHNHVIALGHTSSDSGMAEKNIDDNHDGDVQTYAADLVAKIKVSPSVLFPSPS